MDDADFSGVHCALRLLFYRRDDLYRRQRQAHAHLAAGRDWSYPGQAGIHGDVRQAYLGRDVRSDYCFTDAMTFTDDNGKRMRIWLPDEIGVIPDKQAFMEMYVKRILGVMKEPIDIYVNATFLPDQIAGEYDVLWTPERMRKVIDAAVENDVAIEINRSEEHTSELQS